MGRAEPALVILVIGRPASGKTTTARRIVERFGLPLLAKDAFKEILFDRLGAGDREWSTALGRAAFDVLEHAVEQQLCAGGSFVIEAPYTAQRENERFQSWQHRFGFRTLQIQCVASEVVLVQRFIDRASSGLRHPGHDDAEHVGEFRASLSDSRGEALALAGEVLTVRVAEPGALERVLDRVGSELRTERSKRQSQLDERRPEAFGA